MSKKKTALQLAIELFERGTGTLTPSDVVSMLKPYLPVEREQIDKAVNHGISIDVHSQNNHIDFAKSYYLNTYEQ